MRTRKVDPMKSKSFRSHTRAVSFILTSCDHKQNIDALGSPFHHRIHPSIHPSIYPSGRIVCLFTKSRYIKQKQRQRQRQRQLQRFNTHELTANAASKTLIMPPNRKAAHENLVSNVLMIDGTHSTNILRHSSKSNLQSTNVVDDDDHCYWEWKPDKEIETLLIEEHRSTSSQSESSSSWRFSSQRAMETVTTCDRELSSSYYYWDWEHWPEKHESVDENPDASYYWMDPIVSEDNAVKALYKSNRRTFQVQLLRAEQQSGRYWEGL